jgi:hypothetical protein
MGSTTIYMGRHRRCSAQQMQRTADAAHSRQQYTQQAARRITQIKNEKYPSDANEA